MMRQLRLSDFGFCDSALDEAVQLISTIGKTHELVVVPFSSGKDSTMLLDLALKHAECPVHVIYADTLVEIPPIRKLAFEVLRRVSRLCDVTVHVVRPAPEDRFWSCLVGKGYPPPSQRFRWCTDRLKIKPQRQIVRKLVQRGGALLLGVRLEESRARKKSIQKWLCEYGKIRTPYGVYGYAPLMRLTSHDVWNYLISEAPAWGTSNDELHRLYAAAGDNGRFGCWVCTLVRDATLQALATIDETCRALLEFKEWLRGFSANPQNRVLRQGVPRSLTINARLEIYQKLKRLEKAVQEPIVTQEEENIIARRLGLGV